MEVRRFPLLIVLVVVAAAGCSVGEYGTSDPVSMNPDAAQMSGGTSEASFNSMVKPLVGTCTGCHGAQPPTLTSYAALQAKYKAKSTASILVTKGDHQGITYFNTTDKAAIQGWINGLP